MTSESLKCEPKRDRKFMTPDEIIFSIRQKGYSLSMIAEVLQKSPSMISKVINRRAKSFPIAQAISKILERKVSDVFPSLYESDDQPVRKNMPGYMDKRRELESILSEVTKSTL